MMCATVFFISENEQRYEELKQFFAETEICMNYFQPLHLELGELLEQQPDMIVLDCKEEGFHELTLCESIRNLYTGALILLSSQEKEQFTLLALKLGADLTLTTRNSMLILAANIRSIVQWFDPFASSVLQFGALSINSRKRDAFLCGSQLNLSKIEFELLWLLGQKAGQVVSRAAIHKNLYDTQYNGYDRSIDLYVSRIRQKIGDDPVSPRYLKTVRGTGYQLIADLQQRMPEADDTNCYTADTQGL